MAAGAACVGVAALCRTGPVHGRPSLGGEQFRDARNKYADALFALAKRAAEAGQLSLAFEWATETVRENPDHADARRVLGYEQHDGQWLTPYCQADGRRRQELGSAGRLGRERTTRRSESQAGHRDGWQVRTDHFLVTTNHSLDAAAELAARLERLHQVWRQLFAGFYLHRARSPRAVRRRAAAAQAAPAVSRVLPPRQGRLRRRAPPPPAADRRNARHLFRRRPRSPLLRRGDETRTRPARSTTRPSTSCSRKRGPPPGTSARPANFWIIEGVATYFETLTEHRDPEAGLYYTIGESSAGRLPAARERLLADGFYVPLAELDELGKDDLQRHPEIAKLYSQSTGLAAFLMDGDGGRYREPLVVYLTAVYAGRDDAESLSDATGATNSELDAAYRRYMESLP